MNNQQIIILMVGVLVIAVAVLVAALLIGREQKKIASVKQVRLGKGNDIWFKLYCTFSKFFLTKRYLQKIRRRIEMVELSDNWTVSRKTVQFSAISLGLCFAIFIILVLMDLDFYYFLVSLLTIVIIHNQVINMFIDNIENKLLKQFDKFLGDVRHHYHEHGMIDEAIYDSVEECKYEMSLHAHKMYSVLTSNDPENELDKYNDVAPNKFFKTFLANCYSVQRFGDKIVDNESMFLSNLNYLKQEINLEMLRRQKLDYMFKSLSIIAIAPIFVLKPLEKWGVSNMPEMAAYYDGAYGFLAQIGLFLLVILAYQLINRLHREPEDSEVENTLYEKLFKVPFITAFVKMLKNKNYSKTLRYAEVLKVAGIRQSVEYFYLKRLIYMLLGGLICIFVIVNVHFISRNNILDSSQNLAKQVKDIDKEAEKALLKFDKEYILKFSFKKPSFSAIEAAITGSGEIKDKKLVSIAAKRIIDKITLYEKEYFKWWELLICLVVALISYNIPYWLMIFRKKVMEMNMEDEVMQFHTIILMLMHIDRISVDDILKWMEQFAVIFKESIGKCLNDFENGDIEALEQLKIDEPFPAFTRIIENLESASDKIPIERAFDQLKVERGYYQEKRKQDNEIIVNTKGAWGKMIAYIPLGATTFFYLILPFAMVSIQQLSSYSSQISS